VSIRTRSVFSIDYYRNLKDVILVQYYRKFAAPNS